MHVSKPPSIPSYRNFPPLSTPAGQRLLATRSRCRVTHRADPPGTSRVPGASQSRCPGSCSRGRSESGLGHTVSATCQHSVPALSDIDIRALDSRHGVAGKPDAPFRQSDVGRANSPTIATLAAARWSSSFAKPRPGEGGRHLRRCLGVGPPDSRDAPVTQRGVGVIPAGSASVPGPCRLWRAWSVLAGWGPFMSCSSGDRSDLSARTRCPEGVPWARTCSTC